MLPVNDYLTIQNLASLTRTILALVLPILTHIGATTMGSLAQIWDELFGAKPLFSVSFVTIEGIILGEVINGIKTFVLPPKKLEWWETEEFHTFLGLVELLLAVWSLRRWLRGGR